MAELNLSAFVAAVHQHSPLQPWQIEALIGDIAERKALAWQFMRLPPVLQMQAWAAVKAFPEASVLVVR